jgi:hypothetical protein
MPPWLAPPVPVGVRGRPPYFPSLAWPWSLLILSAVYSAWVPSTAPTLRRASVDRPRSAGFQDQACMGPFVWPLGALWVSGARGSCAGVPGAAAVFTCPVLDSGICFSVVLVHFGYGWRVWQVAPAFPSPSWSADSFRIQLLCHIFIRSRGSHRYSPATRPDTLVTMATTTTSTRSKMGHLLIGAVGIRHHLGVLTCVWGSFGVSSGTPLGSLWPLLGARTPPVPV